MPPLTSVVLGETQITRGVPKLHGSMGPSQGRAGPGGRGRGRRGYPSLRSNLRLSISQARRRDGACGRTTGQQSNATEAPSKCRLAQLTSICQSASNRTQLPLACAIDKRPMRWATYAGCMASGAISAPNSGMSHFNTASANLSTTAICYVMYFNTAFLCCFKTGSSRQWRKSAMKSRKSALVWRLLSSAGRRTKNRRGPRRKDTA